MGKALRTLKETLTIKNLTYKGMPWLGFDGQRNERKECCEIVFSDANRFTDGRVSYGARNQILDVAWGDILSFFCLTPLFCFSLITLREFIPLYVWRGPLPCPCVTPVFIIDYIVSCSCPPGPGVSSTFFSCLFVLLLFCPVSIAALWLVQICVLHKIQETVFTYKRSHTNVHIQTFGCVR